MESTVNALGNPERSGLAGSARRDRFAAAFLVVVMVAASPILWIGVPLGSSWVAAQLTDDQTTHLQITVPLTIAGMVLFGRLLFWINRLYVRIRAHGGGLEGEENQEEDLPRFVRGPLEPILIGSLLIALIALTVWFFFFAENPSELVY